MKASVFTIALVLSLEGLAQQQPPPPSGQATSTINATASGSTTAVTTDVKPKDSPIGFLAISVAEVAADELRDKNDRAAVATTNAIGMTYKTGPDAKIGLRQYFTYLSDADKGSKFDMAPTVLTYSQKVGSIFGSDDVSPLLWVYLPTNEKAVQDRSNGKLRLTNYITWTLSPKWSVTYYADPRQSFIPTSVAADGTEVYSHSTWLHGGSVSYNFSDTISIYQSLGTSEDFRTNTMTLLEESIDLSTGMYISVGKFLFIPDLTNSLPTVSKGKSQGGPLNSSTLYRAEQMIYSLSMLASF